MSSAKWIRLTLQPGTQPSLCIDTELHSFPDAEASLRCKINHVKRAAQAEQQQRWLHIVPPSSLPCVCPPAGQPAALQASGGREKGRDGATHYIHGERRIALKTELKRVPVHGKSLYNTTLSVCTEGHFL